MASTFANVSRLFPSHLTEAPAIRGTPSSAIENYPGTEGNLTPSYCYGWLLSDEHVLALNARHDITNACARYTDPDIFFEQVIQPLWRVKFVEFKEFVYCYVVVCT